MLVILDNACDSDQVRPLLPGTPGCLTLVTSRDALPGLVARDGARRLDLDVFPLADAINLLRALIGARVDAEPEAAAALAAACCRLPLALRVAAELAAARPAASLASLTAELADQQRRLDLLEAGGDTRTAVRAVFSWSSRQLDPDMARAFRLIGLFPGPDLDAYAIAALTGGSLTRSREILTRLARAHLVQPVGPGRHGMHDLLRDYARELAAADDTEHERAAAMTRLLDYSCTPPRPQRRLCSRPGSVARRQLRHRRRRCLPLQIPQRRGPGSTRSLSAWSRRPHARPTAPGLVMPAS
jgi:hypothetical protein